MEVTFNAKVSISDDKIEVTYGGISAVITSPAGIAEIQRTIAHNVLQAALYNQTDWMAQDLYGDSQKMAETYNSKRAVDRAFGGGGIMPGAAIVNAAHRGIVAAERAAERAHTERTLGAFGEPAGQMQLSEDSAEIGRAILASGNGAPKSLHETQ